MKTKKIIIFILSTMLLTACQQTPSSTIINNDELEITTDATMEAIDKNNLPVINISTEEMDEVIECEDVSITLKGMISKPDSYNDIYLYTANVINYNEYESNMMFLFGEYEDLAVRVRDKFIMVDTEDGYHADLTNTSLAAPTEITCPWGDIWFDRNENPVSEDMRKVDMTDEEARNQADEILDRIGTTEFECDRSKYHEETLQITPDGNLSSPLGDNLTVYYVQKIQGIPIRTTLVESRIRPRAYVTFDSRGVNYVSISEYEYDVYSKLEQCVSYEEALQLFKDYISKNGLNDGNLYTSMEFQYTINKIYVNGNFVELAIPFWVFDKENHPEALWDPRGDIYINCMDGSITET